MRALSFMPTSMELRNVWQPHLSEVPSHPCESLCPSCCSKDYGPSRGHGASSLHFSAVILQPPSSDILFFQDEPQTAILTKVWQHERQCFNLLRTPRSGIRIQTQLSWSSKQHPNNSNGKIGIYSYTAAPFRKYSRNVAEVSGYLKLILQVIQMPARKTACRIREHCWDQA